MKNEISCFVHLKVSQKRSIAISGGVNIGKQEQDDDQRSTSSREEEILFNASGGGASPNASSGVTNPEKGTVLAMLSDRRGRPSVKKARLSSTASSTSMTSTAAFSKDLVRALKPSN